MKTKILLISVVGILLTASCSKQMEYKEYNIFDKEYITRNFSNVGGFMTDIYNTVEYDFGNFSNGAMLASASDESVYSKIGNPIEDFYNGAWSPSNPKSSLWSAMYEGIATCNTVLTEMQGLTFDELVLNKDYIQQMHRYQNYQYECRFMRAYFYFCLARQYGGVPIVGEELTIQEINALSRSSSDDVFEFVISECKDIQDKIIANYSDLGDYSLSTEETGRADRLAVLALKARAALYWASPLFNPNNDKERWHQAALYNKELIDACQGRKDLASKYDDLWSTQNYTTASITKEIIFARRYFTSTNGDHLVEGYNYPVGIEGGEGGNCPTQNLVDAYDMKNGKAIDENGSGYNENNPYADRDPRLNLTVAVNGSTWPTYSGASPLQTYEGGANGQPLSGATTTGYYLKKLCHGEISLASSGRVKNNFHSYVIFRMGGVYLDYAEAVFRWLGSADATSSEFPMSAREAASKTRVRAGLPAFVSGLSNEVFWTKYKKERMVELAFEGHRFWDVRRWKEAKQYFTSVTEMKITKNVDDSFSYTRHNVSRLWDDKMYLFPIPQTEILKNGNLTQNPGW
ncbi:MAG: RagB/SusD family nutrient uptake outer membrane protein [Bacteroidota bacterium]|jgi:hypothetical protein|nr:RagB/SusD family nutrient uptake outer membrane protein [Bacteroidota bacterium]